MRSPCVIAIAVLMAACGAERPAVEVKPVDVATPAPPPPDTETTTAEPAKVALVIRVMR